MRVVKSNLMAQSVGYRKQKKQQQKKRKREHKLFDIITSSFLIVFVCLLVISRLSHDGDQYKTKAKWNCLGIALLNRSISANEYMKDNIFELRRKI